MGKTKRSGNIRGESFIKSFQHTVIAPANALTWILQFVLILSDISQPLDLSRLCPKLILDAFAVLKGLTKDTLKAFDDFKNEEKTFMR